MLEFTQIPSFQSCTPLEFPQYVCKVLGRSVSWLWSYGHTHTHTHTLSISSFILFTDNWNIFWSHRDPHVLVDTANGEFKLVHDWIRANIISLHVDKINYVLVSNSITELPGHIGVNLIHRDRLDPTTFLGLFIDNNLSSKGYSDYRHEFLSPNVGIINKLRVFSQYMYFLSYSTLMLPYLNYGILSCGGNVSNTDWERILLIEKRASELLLILVFILTLMCYFSTKRFWKLMICSILI